MQITARRISGDSELRDARREAATKLNIVLDSNSSGRLPETECKIIIKSQAALKRPKP